MHAVSVPALQNSSEVEFFPPHSISHDSMDSFYDYIWDVTILEYLTCILFKEHSISDHQQSVIRSYQS